MDEDVNPDDLAAAVGAAVNVKSHVEKNTTDQCGYCGQHYGPDDVVIERELYGRKWVFCNEECLESFKEHSNFKDQDLDGDPEIHVNINRED